ncbi:helix-turn-helix domain-containing protein [Kyrpidia tusciae]|uniref:Helix-turn-helix domain-containing protein n=1 Tax=Kyrpidia tusciae (strain DSM 2912 / NBRC 15312 / T2) TaxID=562970 RepID=D5WVE4_KYRT2|nr:helix-turn-helix domain-containing protein [Kyrpidia tusciae]ADG05554.1 hypothetical protein Btus_0799 [Kyrpidia tusciae DSM 2912]
MLNQNHDESSVLYEVMTISEAEKMWGLGKDTLRKSIDRGRFARHEVRKSGGTWLITRKAVERHYGQPPIEQATEDEVKNALEQFITKYKSALDRLAKQ